MNRYTLDSAISRLCDLAGLDPDHVPKGRRIDLLIRCFAEHLQQKRWELVGGKWKLKGDHHELCPACTRRPQSDDGICRECLLIRLIEAYERERELLPLEQEWDVARQRSHRNNNNGSEPAFIMNGRRKGATG